MTIATIATDYAPLDQVEYRRQELIGRALHCARPVLFEGQERFVRAALSSLKGGRVEMTVYLTGSSEPIDSSRIAMIEIKGE